MAKVETQVTKNVIASSVLLLKYSSQEIRIGILINNNIMFIIRLGLVFSKSIVESRYKTYFDFETAIPHYIEGVLGSYFLPTSRQHNVVLPSENGRFALADKF